MRVVLAGASGLIGTALADSLRGSGDEVVRLVRRTPSAPDEVQWWPESSGVPDDALQGADAVVNLCGASIAGRRWSGQYKQQLRDSRIVPTSVLSEAVARCGVSVLVNGSATGFYGDTADREVDESASAGSGFLADLTREWEQTARATPSARVALVRTAPVFSRSGGLMSRLRPLFSLGLGARLGDGHQYFPWITLTDEVRIIEFLLRTEIEGPVNACGPQQVTNAEFTRAFAASVHRPALFWVPSAVLHLAGGELADEMLLAGQRAVPKVLADHAFEFTHPTIDSACEYANA